MAIFPGAINKPITASKGRQRLTLYHRLNLHVAVSEAASLHDLFNRTGQVDSHFYVRRDGTVEQYVDTDWRAFADLDGNDATISVETQGGVNNPDSEPWTTAQLEALAQLYAWVVRTHGIAHKIATSSHADERSRGLSWHRLGIDGNFPALPDPRAGRIQRGGGIRYSSATGKICPGAGKINQIPGIFERATQILGTTPNPPTSEEDDMTPEQAAQLTRIHDMIAVPGQPYGYPQAILNDIRAVARDVTTIQATLNVPGQPFAYPAATHNAVGGLIQRVTALQSAVAALSPSTAS